MEEKNSFVFYKSFYDALSIIKNKKLKADIYDAICELGLNNHVQKLDDSVGKMVMHLITPQINANNKKYLNGLKGGCPKGIKKPSMIGNQNAKKKQTKPKQNQNKTKTKPNVNENDNVNDNDNVNNINNMSIIYNWNDNVLCECETDKGNVCKRRSTYKINNKNYCNQHSKRIISKQITNKKKYGNYQRILLTDEEYEKLIKDFSEEYILKIIDCLDEYVESNNNKNKYKNFNLVIRKAIRENWFKNQTNVPDWFNETNNKTKKQNETELNELQNILETF